MSRPDPVVFIVNDDPLIRDAFASLMRSVRLSVESFLGPRVSAAVGVWTRLAPGT